MDPTEKHYPESSAAERVFAIPELLEHILTFLLWDLLPITDHEDPRSRRVFVNARILKHLLLCTEVNHVWRQSILRSSRFRRFLYLIPDYSTARSWDHDAESSHAKRGRRGLLGNYYTLPSACAPQLNPIIQTTFSTYHFRFWHLNVEVTGNRHCAYLIITRRDIPAVHLRTRSGQGRSISEMLLSQPPCMELRATIWEERDIMKDYVGKTSALKDPTIRCDTGVTLGLLHESVKRMFDEHRDVTAIKLTTV